MDVNGHHIDSRRSVGAVPPITVQQLVYDPVRMGRRKTPIADETGDSRPFLGSLRCLRIRIGCNTGQSGQTGHTGYPQHFTPGEERARLHSFGDWGWICRTGCDVALLLSHDGYSTPLDIGSFSTINASTGSLWGTNPRSPEQRNMSRVERKSEPEVSTRWCSSCG